MPIRFQCSCGKSLAVPDERAGAKARCPQCKQVVQIPKPAPPAAEEQHVICPKCGGIAEPGAVKCAQCGISFRPSTRAIHVERSSLLDRAPFRWIDEHKGKIGAALVAVGIFVIYRALSSPGSAAYDSYRKFADLLLEAEFEEAKKMAEGTALEQIDFVKGREGFMTGKRREVLTARSLYILLAEDFSGDGNSATVRLTQQYWDTVPGSLVTQGEQMEREHTAQMVRRDGRWVVASFEMTPGRKVGEGKGAAVAKASIIKVDAAGCGVSTESPLGTLDKMDERIVEAGMAKAPPKEDNPRWGGEPVQTQPYDYQLRAREGGSWPESIEIEINLERKVRTVRAAFRIRGAAGAPVEESRVARFAADYWKLVFGSEPAFDKDGRARAERGSLSGEWKQDRAQSKEFLAVSAKPGERPERDMIWQYSKRAHRARISAVGSFPGSGETFTAGHDGAAVVFHRTGYEEKVEHPGAVTGVVSGPEGLTLATACADGKVRRWRRQGVDTKFEKTAEWAAHEGGVAALALQPGGGLLASAGEDGTVKLWEESTLKATLRGHASGVTGVAFRPDGTLLASAGKDGTVRLWDVQSAAERHAFQGHEGAVLSAAFDADGELLASGGSDGTVRLWSVSNRKAAGVLKGHEGGVNAVLFLHGGRVAVSCGEDRTLRLWNAESREALRILRSFGGITCLAAEEGGTSLIGGGDDGFFRTWSIWGLETPETRKPGGGETAARTVSLGSPIQDFKRVLLSPNGRALVVWDPGSGAAVWNPVDGKPLPPPQFGTSAFSVALSPDGRVLAGGLITGTIRVFEVETGRELATIEGLKAPAAALALSLDGRRAASEVRYDAGSLVQIWDVAARKLVSEAQCRAAVEVSALGFSPDGERLVAAMSDGTIHLFDAGNGKRIRNLTGHQGGLGSLAFNADGSLLATGGRDGSVRVWRLADGAQLRSFRDHSGPVSSVALDAKGGFVVSAGTEVILRTVATAGEPRVLEGGAKQAGPAAFAAEGAEVAWIDGAKGEARFWSLTK